MHRRSMRGSIICSHAARRRSRTCSITWAASDSRNSSTRSRHSSPSQVRRYARAIIPPACRAWAARSRRGRAALRAAFWAQYSVVRAYEAVAAPPLETLHALRIDFKRLRYLLEFFQGTLGTRTAQLIELTIRVQDHLSLLQDACVASNLLRAFIAEKASLTAADPAGVAEYLNALQVEIQSRREQFPALYAEITGKPFRRQLARLLSNV